MSKLTLSIRQAVIVKAKEYAKSNGKSLSSIVEEYLKSLTEPPGSEKSKSPNRLVSELRGAVKIPEDFTSYEETLKEALIEKYLKQ